MRKIVSLLFIFLPALIFSQTTEPPDNSSLPGIPEKKPIKKKNSEFDFGANYMSVLNCNVFPFSMGFGREIRPKYFIDFGLLGQFGEHKLNTSFGYPTNKPKLGFGSATFINEFRIVDKGKFSLDLIGELGYMPFTLDDGNHYHATRYGRDYDTFATNNYIRVSPGVNAIFSISNDTRLFLKTNYNFMFGKTEFASVKTFDVFSVALGFRFENM